MFGEDREVLNEEPVAVTDAVQSSDAGTYPIYFTGGSDDNYTFSFVTGTLTILKIDQAIDFSPVPSELRVTETYPLEATATSGLPVSFSASDQDIVSFNDNIMTIQREGTVTITASNSGNINYNAAPDVSRVITTLPAFDNSMSLFTPNGDGINDYWYIPWIDLLLGRTDVKVFNRHGRMVYESQGYANDWDGTSNGSPLPEGSYYYVIDSAEKGILKGVVNIVR
jgi:gliding motility-associated-like protein